jgi:hypothetical protein
MADIYTFPFISRFANCNVCLYMPANLFMHAEMIGASASRYLHLLESKAVMGSETHFLSDYCCVFL